MGVWATTILVRALVRGCRAAANVRLAGANRRMQGEVHRAWNSRRSVHNFQRGAEILAEGSVGPERVVEHGLASRHALWQAHQREQQSDRHRRWLLHVRFGRAEDVGDQQRRQAAVV